MLTFKDLVFKKHPNNLAGFDTQAKAEFPNGYGISVVTGTSAYCGKGTYEAAVLFEGRLCRGATYGDVLGYQSPEEIDDLMIELQNL